MSWLKKTVKKLGNAVRKVGNVMSGATLGVSDMLGVGKAFDLAGRGVDELTGKAHDDREKEKDKKIAQLNAAEAAAKTAADADYYNRVMKERDRQIAAYLDSQTDLTQEGEALGDYGKTLGSFGNTALGGKKKKMYY